MHYVYIIKDNKIGDLYYGYTDNLRQYIWEHNKGRNLELIYYEACKSEEDAYNREMCLRNYALASAVLKNRLKESLE